MRANEEFKEVSVGELVDEIVRRLSAVKPESSIDMLKVEAN